MHVCMAGMKEVVEGIHGPVNHLVLWLWVTAKRLAPLSTPDFVWSWRGALALEKPKHWCVSEHYITSGQLFKELRKTKRNAICLVGPRR